MVEWVMILFVTSGGYWGGPTNIPGFSSEDACNRAIPSVVRAYRAGSGPGVFDANAYVKFATCIRIEK
jgi:hypothetical protein